MSCQKRRKKRFKDQYTLDDYDSKVLCAEKETAKFYEEVVQNCDPQIAAKWIIGELNALLNKNELSLQIQKLHLQILLHLS